jgi:hypothetical protein
MNSDTPLWEPHRAIFKYIKSICPDTIGNIGTTITDDCTPPGQRTSMFKTTTEFKLNNGMNLFLHTTTWCKNPLKRDRQYDSKLELQSGNKKITCTIELPMHYTTTINGNERRELFAWLEDVSVPPRPDKLCNLTEMVLLEWSEILSVFGKLETENIRMNVICMPNEKCTSYSLKIECQIPWKKVANWSLGTQTKTFSFQRQEDKSIFFNEMNLTIQGDDEEKRKCFEKIKAFIDTKLGIENFQSKFDLHNIEQRIDNILLRNIYKTHEAC